ncbi:MAG: 6,7-dimethyl-8-ribityllumazine synthase [Gemmatimonadales bacterium]
MMRALVVVSRFNEDVTRRLLDGAVRTLAEAGYGDRTDVVWVPGAFELPVTMDRGLGTGRYALGVALGAVIRGDTYHFEVIANEATRGLGEVALSHGLPVGFGLLTCDTDEQAMARAGGAHGNKGADAAQAALETLKVISQLDPDAAT